MLRRRRNVVVAACCAVLALFLQECRDSVTGYTTGDLQTMIPLKVGAGWTYLDITPSSLPSFPDDSTVVHSQVNRYVDSANIRVYALNGFIGEGDSGEYYESVTQTTYQRYRDNDAGRRVVVATILQTPVARGHRWFINGADASAGYAEVANPDTTIDLASGRFADVICVRELTPLGSVWYIKPAVGIVYESRFENVTVTRQLLDKNF